ncbi:hypothetical protein CLOM_g8362 [Closterium sp. NIES-68]|nr:hypothetical protein CLOM_g8362 [Closterium sp. NIES-68]
MAFKLGRLNLNAVAQGVGGLVFGSGDDQEDDGGVERLLDRISNGVLAEDRQSAMADLRDVVTDSPVAQQALGAMGIPVLLSVLREDREDVDLVRGALEVLVAGLAAAAADTYHRSTGHQRVSPGVINSELFAREPNSIALLLGLLEEEDFYIRYHTVQLLTILLSNCPHRLQEAILVIPQGVGRLMDMMALNEREVIRNEALVLMINLTRSAEEIQKIVVFEGAFERAFNIIRDEGGADGGIVVQDCMELINNLLRSNASNQIFLRETLGLARIPSLLLSLRKYATAAAGSGSSSSGNDTSGNTSSSGGGSDSTSVERTEPLTRQKAANLLCGLETVALLLARSPHAATPKDDTNLIANQTMLGHAKLMDALLALAFDPLVNSTAIRTQALKALGGLVLGHAANREELGSKLLSRSDPTTYLYRDAGFAPKGGRRGGGGGGGNEGWGEEEEVEDLLRGVADDMEPALHCVLRVALRAVTTRESSAADYAIRCFCEGNSEGQTMLASTITPLPQGVSGKGKRGGGGAGPDAADDAANLTFGGILVRALIGGQSEQALEASCRAASVLSHLLKDNSAAKERVLRIPLQIPTSALAPPELLMPRIMRYLAAAAAPPPPPSSSHSHSHQSASHSLYASFASSFSSFSSSSSPSSSSPSAVWLQPVLLRLLLTWLSDCPPAVSAFLAPPGHLPFIVGLVSAASSAAAAAAMPAGGPGEDGEDHEGTGGGYGEGYSDGYDGTGERRRGGGGGGEGDGRGMDEGGGGAAGGLAVHVGGLAALVLGACVVFNDNSGATDAATVVDIITQRIGLAAFFARIEDLKRDSYFLAGGAVQRPPKPLTRATAAAEATAGGSGVGGSEVNGSGSSEITEEGGQAAAAAGMKAALSRAPPAPSSSVSSGLGMEFEPPIASFYDREFVQSVLELEEAVRKRVVQLFSMPRGGEGRGKGGEGVWM